MASLVTGSGPRRPSAPPPPTAASSFSSSLLNDKNLKSKWSDHSLHPEHLLSDRKSSFTRVLAHKAGVSKPDPKRDHSPIVNITQQDQDSQLVDELDYVTVEPPPPSQSSILRPDKASRILGIKHRQSMEPIPASARNSIMSTRSAREPPPTPSFTPSLPLTSLYVVSGLPKSPHTWTLADPDAVLGLHHTDGAVNRWWRPEVLGSTVSPGAGGSKKKKRGKDEILKGAGALSKQEVGKMLSKALKLSFTREVEVIASTLQPASTVHTFTFTLPAPNTPLAPSSSNDLLRASILTTSDRPTSAISNSYAYPYTDDPFARPSSAYLGPPSLLGHSQSHHSPLGFGPGAAPNAADFAQPAPSTVTYHGVCLTVWSHADAERSNAIRRTLEAGRSRKESAQSLVASRLKSLRQDAGSADAGPDPTSQARRNARKSARGPWADAETDGAETEGEGAMSESDFEIASTVGHGPGESTLFLPGDTVFWLPYALTLVSRHPVYDLMRDYLTLSWARFSKDVQSHTLQISKILAHPAPRAGDLIKLDASPKNDSGDTNLEVIARFPGGLDFGRGLVDINFTMWPLFKALNIDNILTICEVALSPTGRVLFFSRHPAMLGIAVSTIKYLVELRGWNGIALPAVHARDAKIYIEDPGPWIIGLATEMRYSVRASPEVCVCDLDINYLSCPSPPPGAVSQKQQREKYRQRLLTAFDAHYHPDHCVPSEFKEAFPAGRFRPVCKIQAKRGASSSAVAEQIKPPEWWHSTRIIQAFDNVLQDKFKKPSLLKRISMFGSARRQPQLTAAEQHIQLSIRKRATAFVDARDDLETKIGRLSRRLNFLMTESDLWRDKFVTFEQYAEKLSAEATQLRAKINKEQRETKRLSGLVSMTAAEKSKLQMQLRDTEKEHKDAVLELQAMRETMDRMELERAEMVAEVEAQIERALASMAVDIEDSASEYASSRPVSRLSSTSNPTRSRRASDAGSKGRLRSFPTDSTLAETYESEHDNTLTANGVAKKLERENGTIKEEDEEALSETKRKRFSATDVEAPQDGMNAVDEGISQKTDKIAQKVLQIQQKLETALAADRRTNKWRHQAASLESEEELSESQTRAPRAKVASHPRPPRARGRSGTASSTQTNSSTPAQTDDGTVSTATVPASGSGMRPRLTVSPEAKRNKTPTRASTETARSDDVVMPSHSVQSLRAVRPDTPPELTPSTPSLTPAPSTIAEDSDTDFQSAYSTSPRESYVDDAQNAADVDEGRVPLDHAHIPSIDDYEASLADSVFISKRRERLSSTSTATVVTSHDVAEPSPTLSEDTIISRGRTTSRARATPSA
ncbi:hypothetical protein HGRIS_007920 [Hohenbuehelia grisea]|uniref:cDENN domain-containing protein n=1 Tax=Hohenbuehelia grisea TaxID=104357 RepID=A0ABR3J6K5_9AGAR